MASANAAGAALAELVAGLVQDSELDVRIAVALQAAALVPGLGAAFIEHVRPTLDALVREEAVSVRAELAAVFVPRAARRGGRRRAAAALVQLLEDATDVRLSVIYRLATSSRSSVSTVTRAACPLLRS